MIGASLSEPHIDEVNARNPYIIIMYGTSVTRNYIPSDLYGHKREIFYCAFSCLGHGPYIRRSDLANCKFTLVLALLSACNIENMTGAWGRGYSVPVPYVYCVVLREGSKRGESEAELVISSTAQRDQLLKNAIKID